MANDTIITITGNLTADPELRFTPNGAAVSNFTIASTPRQFDKQRGEWADGEPMFIRCNVWRDMAENVADSLAKGMRVIAQGRLKSRTFDTKEGERRTVFELDVDEIGPSLLFARAQVARAGRGGQVQGQQTAQGGWSGSTQQGQYGQGGSAQQGGGWAANPNQQSGPAPWDVPQDAQNSAGAPFQA